MSAAARHSNDVTLSLGLVIFVWRLSVFADSVWNKDSSLDGFNPSDSIILLVKCTEKLLCIAMETENGHALMQHATASFYEVV